MLVIWSIVVAFSAISLVTSNPAPLIAGLILAAIGVIVERLYK
jgi:hypothetical protein